MADIAYFVLDEPIHIERNNTQYSVLTARLDSPVPLETVSRNMKTMMPGRLHPSCSLRVKILLKNNFYAERPIPPVPDGHGESKHEISSKPNTN